MSRFFSQKFENLKPYTPGEQPKEREYIKLNTNESPFPPSKKAEEYARRASGGLQLYSDIHCASLADKLASLYDVGRENILFTNGSDEALNFAFAVFCDDTCPAVFPDITYGFYPVFAQLNKVPYLEIPLKEDFTINIEDYVGCHKTIFIANPNAPTGIALSLSDIETILASNPNNVVVVDEAYVDFGGKSAVSLIGEYENLLVVQTFSKSRSLAGARLGMAIGSAHLIQDLNTIKFSTNPYNVNSLTQAAGLGALDDHDYFQNNCTTIIDNRTYLTQELNALGFALTPSAANFVFAKHEDCKGEELYAKLKEHGILVRHFNNPRIVDYIRITVGTREQIDVLLGAIGKITGVK